MRVLTTCLGLIMMVLTVTGMAPLKGEAPAPGPEGDKTLAPYFWVASDDPTVEALPLKSSRADVKIAGVAAEVALTQVYRNQGKKTLEAVYVFPASTRAAVHALRMTIGSRVIEAQVMERAQARQTYETAKQEGKTTSLLEQQRPNVFQMNVGNILPGDEIKVELRYFELVVPQQATYEFVLPTVVGPRYSSMPAAGAPETEKWVANPYLRQGEPAPFNFGLRASLSSAVPIAALTSPSHEVDVKYHSPTQADIRIKDEARAATKDFVLRYNLTGGQIETGLLLYPGKEDNHFLLMVEPPARVKAEAVLPREYIFIVDVSGSMHGFPLDTAKALAAEIFRGLTPQEFLNVLLFESQAAVLSPGGSVAATEENKAKALEWIKKQPGGGGTEILAALRQALALPKTPGTARTVVVITDGYVHVEQAAFELIHRSLGEANLFAFGVGRSVNRFLIEGMARAGRGEPFVVLQPREAAAQVRRFQEYVAQPLLTEIAVKGEGFEIYDLEPEKVPDLFAQRPLTVLGKYRGTPDGVVVVTGKTPQGVWEKRLAPAKGAAREDHAAVRLLWARERIKRLSDLNYVAKNEARERQVMALGLKYNLLTPYTSFVAVDQVKRADGQVVTVKQPLPLPEGVSDLAVGDGRGLVSAKLAFSPAMRAGEHRVQEMPYAAQVVPDLAAGGPTPPNVRVQLGKISVEGELEEAVVRAVLEKALPTLAACAHSEPRGKLPGWLIIRFNINSAGRVSWIKVVEWPLNAKPLENCLMQAIEKVRFPASAGEVSRVRLKVTFFAKAPATP